MHATVHAQQCAQHALCWDSTLSLLLPVVVSAGHSSSISPSPYHTLLLLLLLLLIQSPASSPRCKQERLCAPMVPLTCQQSCSMFLPHGAPDVCSQLPAGILVPSKQPQLPFPVLHVYSSCLKAQ